MMAGIAFFAAIDAPFLRICGSCGELTKSKQYVIETFEPEVDRFAPLRNKAGKCEVIAEGVFTDQICGLKKIWLCKRCDKSLRERVVPKFCRASGFRIATVLSELAVLNRMEARLIGLGISFTTCVNLYSDGQEFTRGNSINYWNNAFDVVLDFPRPLSKCGIVYLKTLKAKSTKFFRVRPDLIRRTLCWLIDHNPLYKRVRISEKNLAALRQFDVETNMPTIILTEEESEALRSTENQVNAEATAPVEDEGEGSIQEQRRSNSSTATDASLSDQSDPMNITYGATDNEIRDTYDSVFDSTSSSILQQGKTYVFRQMQRATTTQSIR
ncbi:unnamed protein product [Phytophthora fragariaefolia]|uniref:Unnamed protein product n=1 Tax=Phytophthora fragariaefolia TaxID=1490495 RepID=A0A9W7D4G6_9STRA|nr:unnamed protein product [Phytophthora fragariaefolia]